MSVEFRFIDRGYKKSLVLIPGWATDYRIFSSLELDYNYLLPLKTHSFTAAEELLAVLDKESIDRVSLFGWSMGGFQAVDFALSHPSRVEELILLSIRKQYDPVILEKIALKIKRNKKAFLYRFYLDCFYSCDNDGLAWFKDNLMRDYLDNFTTEELIYGLEYLSQVSISPSKLSLIPRVRIFHGEQDKISSIEDTINIKSLLPGINLVSLKGAGHLPFFNPEFRRYF
jgi:pimeloyl-ACP methyl ester carboxylesterase